jgi:hypothetical protein
MTFSLFNYGIVLIVVLNGKRYGYDIVNPYSLCNIKIAVSSCKNNCNPYQTHSVIATSSDAISLSFYGYHVTVYVLFSIAMLAFARTSSNEVYLCTSDTVNEYISSTNQLVSRIDVR